jgi:hypothetical protein
MIFLQGQGKKRKKSSGAKTKPKKKAKMVVVDSSDVQFTLTCANLRLKAQSLGDKPTGECTYSQEDLKKDGRHSTSSIVPYHPILTSDSVFVRRLRQ